jgi:hypothetical protein
MSDNDISRFILGLQESYSLKVLNLAENGIGNSGAFYISNAFQ